MIVFHRGKGGLVVALSGIFSGLIMHAVTRALFDRHYYSEHIWPLVGSFWLAGLICTAVGWYLRNHPSNVGEGSWFRTESADHFLFIPVIYWGPLYAVAGIVYLILAFR